MSYQIITHENEELIDLSWTVKFATKLGVLDTVRVLQLIVDTLNGSVAAKLFEGLPAIEISVSHLTLHFRFSINADHVQRIEASIGRSELAYHRVNFTYFVFATINQQFKLEGLPDGFEETLDMPDYIG